MKRILFALAECLLRSRFCTIQFTYPTFNPYGKFYVLRGNINDHIGGKMLTIFDGKKNKKHSKGKQAYKESLFFNVTLICKISRISKASYRAEVILFLRLMNCRPQAELYNK